MLTMMRCPYCGSDYYVECGGYTTAVYYPPIYKEGVNVNPDKNKTTEVCRCLECGKEFIVTDGVVDPVVVDPVTD